MTRVSLHIPFSVFSSRSFSSFTISGLLSLGLTVVVYSNKPAKVYFWGTMINSHSCHTRMAPLQPEDSHDLYPSCVGLEHLREGLSEDLSMNCSFMPCAVRVAKLARVERLMGDGCSSSEQFNSAQSIQTKQQAAEAAGAPARRKLSLTSCLLRWTSCLLN